MKFPKPECPYCGATEGLRIQCDGGGYMEPDYICRDDFRGMDDGPGFDDLKPVGQVEVAIDDVDMDALVTRFVMFGRLPQ